MHNETEMNGFNSLSHTAWGRSLIQNNKPVIQMRFSPHLAKPIVCVTVHAGSEAMFADLGHFSYAAIQVMLALLFLFLCNFSV